MREKHQGVVLNAVQAVKKTWHTGDELMIVAANNGGLCNRIRCLISCMRMDKKCYILWRSGGWQKIECRFSDLFANDMEIETIPAGAGVYSSWELAVLPGEDPFKNKGLNLNERGWASIIGGNFSYKDITAQEALRILKNGDIRLVDIRDNIQKAVRLDYVRKLEKLKPVPEVNKIVKTVSSSFRKTVSVTIRSWREHGETGKDITDPEDYCCAHRFHSFKAGNGLQVYFDAMDKFPDHNFFVTADSDMIMEKVFEQYGDRVLTLHKSTPFVDRSSKEALRETLAELILLGKNKVIIGSYVSTFANMAWWMGGCKATLMNIPF